MLKVFLFGSPEILLDERKISVSRRKSRAVFYYLAASSKPVQREQLLSIFWPDLERASALQNLRTTLFGLRKQVGPVLVADEEEVALSAASWVDSRDFASQMHSPPVEIDRLQAALNLYRGDFLQGFSLPDSLDYEEWLVIEREHYRKLAVRGLIRLSRLYEAAGDDHSALAAVDRALSFDPLQEDLQRESLRLYYLSGDRPGAIRKYDQLRKLLDEEMGVPPMAETRRLYDAILQDRYEELRGSGPKLKPAPAASPGSASGEIVSRTGKAQAFDLPFFGREAELKILQEQSGPGWLVLVEGEPGIGKTRLMEHFLRTGEDLALIGAGRELERKLPYQPVIEALRGLSARPEWPALRQALQKGLPDVWLAEAARLLPEINPSLKQLPGVSVGRNDESRLWEGVNQLLLAVSRLQPVALFLDDLQWADASTLGLLGYLVRQPGSGAIRFLAASRPIQPRSPAALLLDNLTREERLIRILLVRLGEEDIHWISRLLSPDYAHPLAQWLLRNSEGNPFVLVDLVRYAFENGILVQAAVEGQKTVTNLTALSTAPVVPQSVYRLIQSRLERLSEPAQRILSAAVAAGREFTFEVVTRASAASEEAALDALDELRSAGLIEPIDANRFRFDHPLTMEVAYREMGELRHRLLHRRVAEVMEQIYPRRKLAEMAGLVAFHFSEGLAPERAAPYALLAGHQAARLAAWSEANQFYEMALLGTEGKERFQTLMALGDARLQAGHVVQASEAYLEALNIARHSEDHSATDGVRLALARSFLSQARFPEAMQLAQKVRQSGQPEHAMSAEFLWGTALSLEGADLDEAVKHLQIAESLCDQQCATESGDQRTELARIKFELGSVSAQRGELQRAVDLYRQALELACSAESEAAIPWCILAHNNLAYHLFLQGDSQAEEYALKGLRMAEEKGMLGQLPYLYSTMGEIAMDRDEPEQASQFFRTGLELAERLGMAERVAGLTANLGRLAADNSETNTAIHLLSKALTQAEALGTHHLAAHIRLWLAPLLPANEARTLLRSTRKFAESGNRQKLLEQVEALERNLS